MKKLFLFLGIISAAAVFANEFVVQKKRKELAIHVKQDIAEELEKALRKIGHNIKSSVEVQDQIFNKVRDLLGEDEKSDFEKSTAELKKIREKLQEFNRLLHQHHISLTNFSDCFA